MTKTLIAIALLLSACSDRDAVQPPAKLPDRWVCTTDADCVSSCRWGAVSKAWYDPNQRDCKDGCNDLTAPPRCIDRSCVAFMHDPHDDKRIVQRDECTRRP